MKWPKPVSQEQQLGLRDWGDLRIQKIKERGGEDGQFQCKRVLFAQKTRHKATTGLKLGGNQG